MFYVGQMHFFYKTGSFFKVMEFEAPKPRSKYMKGAGGPPQKDKFQRELESTLNKRSILLSSNDYSDDDGLGMDDG